MKKSQRIKTMVLLGLIIFFPGCNPVRDILNLDLLITLSVDNFKGLHDHTIVYLATHEEKIPVGQVTGFDKDENRPTAVHLKINAEFRDWVREGSLFMVNRPLISIEPPQILVDTLEEDMNNPPLKSGTTVHETSYAKYRLMTVRNTMKNTVDLFMEKSKDYLNAMEEYLNSNEFNELAEQLDHLAREMETLSKDQKQRFEKEILPQIKKRLDEATKELQTNQRIEKKKRLEEGFTTLKKTLQI